MSTRCNMKINTKLFDSNNNAISIDMLKKNSHDDPSSSIPVVYAHVDEINANGLKLTDTSIVTTRDRYPVYFEHSDNRVEDVVGFIETDGKPNENGEFVGYITFYNTPQGLHAKQLWTDNVITELSVSYYIQDYEEIDTLDDSTAIKVITAILKEVSLVSVGADRNTGEISITGDNDDVDDRDVDGDDKTDDSADNSMSNKITNDSTDINNSDTASEDVSEPVDTNNKPDLEAYKLETLKKLAII